MKSDSMEKLTFGTDGWRDLIADKFTVSNLERAAQGYADALIATGGTYALVGHDTRFMSRDFAFIVANVLLANGLKVQVSEDYLPTPALSFATRHYGADGAVMLTASHNPYRFQGFKLKSQYGGSASQEFYRNVATHVNHIATGEVKRTSAQVSLFDIRDEYYKWLKSLVDVPLLQGAAGTLMHDAMGGAAAGWLTGWFDFAGIPHMVSEFRARPDPMFYGVNPEPIAPNLIAAQEMAREHAPLFIAATDGDGDRLGVILPDGGFFNSHQIFAVLLLHLHARGQRGKVVKTFTVSRIIERLAQRLRLEVLETPVGFKYIAEAMVKGDVLIGGEESGGIGIGGHIPERDGILNSLLLLEAVSRSGKGLSKLFTEAEGLADWQHSYDRMDLHLDNEEQQLQVLQALPTSPESFIGMSVSSIERLDGLKLNLEGDAWILFRASGTEPVLRVYCEASNSQEVTRLLSLTKSWIQQQTGRMP